MTSADLGRSPCARSTRTTAREVVMDRFIIVVGLTVSAIWLTVLAVIAVTQRF